MCGYQACHACFGWVLGPSCILVTRVWMHSCPIVGGFIVRIGPSLFIGLVIASHAVFVSSVGHDQKPVLCSSAVHVAHATLPDGWSERHANRDEGLPVVWCRAVPVDLGACLVRLVQCSRSAIIPSTNSDFLATGVIKGRQLGFLWLTVGTTVWALFALSWVCNCLFVGRAVRIWCVVCVRFAAFTGAGDNSDSCSSALCNNTHVLEYLYVVIIYIIDWH